MVFVVWLVLGVLALVAVLFGVALDVEGGCLGMVIGRFCSIVGFSVFMISLFGFTISLLVL